MKEKTVKMTFNPADILSDFFRKITEEENQIRFVTDNGKISYIGIDILKFSSSFLRKIFSDSQLNNEDITIYLPDVEEDTLHRVVDVLKTGRTFISNTEEADKIRKVGHCLGILYFELDNLEVFSDDNQQEEGSKTEEYFEYDNIKREKVDPVHDKVTAADVDIVKSEDFEKNEENKTIPLSIKRVMTKKNIRTRIRKIDHELHRRLVKPLQ